MQPAQDPDHAGLLLKVHQYVEAQQQEYAALSLEVQRQRGPCTLQELLQLVMAHLAQEVDLGVETTRACCGSLPFAIRDVPALAKVAALQMRLTSTVLSAVSTHPIITLYELEEWVCAMEGVDHFVELGLGVGLQVLPIVQQYFQLRASSVVFPVRTRDILHFLVNDPDAREVLLYGGGDARDLLNRFSHFYARTVLAAEPGADNRPPSAAAPPPPSPIHPPRGEVPRQRGANRRLQNVRQLGVHIQDYASFLACLAQDLAHCGGDARRCSASAMSERVRRRDQNEPLYARMVESFDAACAEMELVAAMRHTREAAALAASRIASATGDTDRVKDSSDSCAHSSSAAARGLKFKVSTLESEARLYTVPLTLWSNAALTEQPKGGVELHFRIGADEVPERTRLPSAATSNIKEATEIAELNSASTSGTTTGCASTAIEFNADGMASIAADRPPTPPPPPCSHGSTPGAGRRRRGAVVSDVASCAPADASPLSIFSVAALSEAAAQPPATTASCLLTSLLRPAGSLGIATAGAVAVAAPATEPNTSIEATAAESPGVEMPKQGDHSRSAAGVAALCVPTPLEQLVAYVHEDKCIKEGLPPAGTTVQATNERVDAGVQLLEHLSAGDTAPVALICDVWRSMRSAFLQQMTLLSAASTQGPGDPPQSLSCARRWRHRSFIPLFSPSARTSPGQGVPSTRGRLASLRQQLGTGDGGRSEGLQGGAAHSPPNSDGAREILYMASPAEVCWSTWLSTMSSSPSLSKRALLCCACLELHYPPELRQAFEELFHVRGPPTLAAWCTSARCLRRVCSPAMLTSGFAEDYLESLVCCVDAEVAARLLDAPEDADGRRISSSLKEDEPSLMVGARRQAEAALQTALDALGDVLETSPLQAALFPCDHAWRCGLDGLLFAPPRLCGYDGVLLSPADAPESRDAPPLRVLCFTTKEPSWGARAVLRYFGVHPLEEVMETRVCFHSTVNIQASGLLHDRIAAIVPYLQGFCRRRFPRWYAMAYPALLQRLRQLKVVLTAVGASAPRQLLRLHWDGRVYAYERAIRLEYVAAHNVVFGFAEDYAVPMLTEALLPLFTPLAMQSDEERLQLRDMVATLLGAVSSLQSSYEEFDASEAERRFLSQADEVLGAFAAAHHFEPFHPQQRAQQDAADGSDSTQRQRAGVMAELPFTLPTRPFGRYQAYFPPGTDALRQPRGPAPSSAHHGAQHQRQLSHCDASSLRRLTRADAAELSTAQRGLVSGGLRSSVQQRFGSDGRLRVTLQLPGSGGSTAVVTSNPAWSEFPLQLDVGSVVEACTGGGTLRRQAFEDGAEVVDEDSEGPTDKGEGFLTFQYHRRGPGRGIAATPMGSSDSGKPRKRLRSETAGNGAGQASLSAGWWLQPPASSAVAGSAGDTPDYAVEAERYVYQLLCTEYAEQMKQQGVRVIWVNEHTEAGSPFDILVVRPRSFVAVARGDGRGARGQPPGRAAGWDVVEFIEVKSTCTSNRQDFELSLSELLLAARFGSAFKVYRVFGASTDKLRRMRCAVYTDLVQMWYRAELTITSEVRVTPSK
ncbi:hypothetical protein ABL78_4815 [Leptomonas seymouri]|uniref:Protein NO VEIN C-terminal domain-containing protein n=1 Tax=Leptomonas seymouri TaxID=5684 RepID=A0A0N1HW17_LEPSE|nr:hypothetical protein ABL78_4815 [Leptomonas seymouri]|eukprot:KPI86123.1 hypothetical protein ABL78_4815 [Leptomonas seymouri]